LDLGVDENSIQNVTIMAEISIFSRRTIASNHSIKLFPKFLQTGNGRREIIPDSFSVKLQRRIFLSNLDKILRRKHSALKI
jgi:hypothetical protein